MAARSSGVPGESLVTKLRSLPDEKGPQLNRAITYRYFFPLHVAMAPRHPSSSRRVLNLLVLAALSQHSSTAFSSAFNKPAKPATKKSVTAASGATRGVATALTPAQKWEQQRKRREAGLKLLKSAAALYKERRERRRAEAKSMTARNESPSRNIPAVPPRSDSVRRDRFAAREPMSKDEAGLPSSTSLAATLSELVVTRAHLAILRTQKASSDAIEECRVSVRAAIGRSLGRGGEAS
jgi:hypothetical protein